MASLELSLRLLVFLALELLAATLPVRALAQSNDITLSLGGVAAQSQMLRSLLGSPHFWLTDKTRFLKEQVIMQNFDHEHTGARKVWLRCEDHADETDERRAVRI